METIEVDIVVIGAGVIGLACAAKLSGKHSLAVLESYPNFGNETSSRNSEVIHSGIYYPVDSLKTKFCIEGRERLYAYCREKNIPHSKVGKYIVAVEKEDSEILQKIEAHARSISVRSERVSASKISDSEPLIKIQEALFFPESGIIDSHVFMASLEQTAKDQGALLAYRHRLKELLPQKNGWDLLVEGPSENLRIQARQVINAAGLAAAEILRLAFPDSPYEHRFCRGRYYVLSSKFQNRFSHLIYPVPQKDGLGVHITIDLSGHARLGPDVDWSNDHRYETHKKLYENDWESLAPDFLKAAQKYCPEVKLSDLTPGLIGIRPKLFKEGKPSPDFYIDQRENLISLLGIESPGLTSSLAIAHFVSRLMNEAGC